MIVNGRSPCAIPKGFSFSKSTMRYNRQLKSLHTLVVYYSLKRLLRKFYIQNVIFAMYVVLKDVNETFDWAEMVGQF